IGDHLTGIGGPAAVEVDPRRIGAFSVHDRRTVVDRGDRKVRDAEYRGQRRPGDRGSRVLQTEIANRGRWLTQLYTAAHPYAHCGPHRPAPAGTPLHRLWPPAGRRWSGGAENSNSDGWPRTSSVKLCRLPTVRSRRSTVVCMPRTNCCVV